MMRGLAWAAAGLLAAGCSPNGFPMPVPILAVPNPNVNATTLEMQLRQQYPNATSIKLEPMLYGQALALFGQTPGPGTPYSYTFDSRVWVATIKGTFENNTPMIRYGAIGGSQAPFDEIKQIIGSDNGQAFQMSMHPSAPSIPPTFFYNIVRPGTNVYEGQELRYETSGTPVDGAVHLTIKAGGQQTERDLRFVDMATWSLKLQPDQVPGLNATDAVQQVVVEERYGNGSSTGTYYVVKDRGAILDAPSLSTAGDWGQAGAAHDVLEAYAHSLAAIDWNGTGLAMSDRVVDKADVEIFPYPNDHWMPQGTVLHEFDVSGTFPKYMLPDQRTTSGRYEVYAPTQLKIVLSETTPIHVMSLKALAP